MTITINIPTFRRPKLLVQAIHSVLQQTHSDFVLCIYDNASQDQTREIVEGIQKQDPRIRYHEHLTNIGMIENYAFALAQIQTDFFCFLSDDDLLLPQFLERALRGFGLYPDIAFAAGSTIIIDDQLEKVVAAPLDFWGKEGYISSKEGVIEMIGKYPVPTSILFKKEVLQQAQIDKQNALFWDCDFLLQIASKSPFYIFKEVCALFRTHQTSYSNSRSFEEAKKAFERLLFRFSQFTLKESDLEEGEKRILNECYKWGRHYFYHYYNQKEFLTALSVGDFLEMHACHTLKSKCVYQVLKNTYKFDLLTNLIHRICLLLKFMLKTGNKEVRRLKKEYQKYIKLLLSPESE